MEKLLYKDKFVELHHDKITIKNYYFPTTKSKIIPLSNIKSVYYDSQENSMIFTIGWGMTIFGVWWGLDLKRQFPSFKTNYSNVILDCGATIKQGFTVVDIDEFLKALQFLLPSNVSMVNKISDKFDAPKTSFAKCVEMSETTTSEKRKLEAEKAKSKFTTCHYYLNGPPPSYDEAVKNFM